MKRVTFVLVGLIFVIGSIVLSKPNRVKKIDLQKNSMAIEHKTLPETFE